VTHKKKRAEQVQTLRDEIKQFRQEHPNISEIDLISLDIPGNFFGKRYAIAQLDKLAEAGLKLPASMYLMCNKGFPVKAMGYGQVDGDPDANMFLVPGSLQQLSWESTQRAQMLLSTSTENTATTQAPLFWEPRVVLQQIIKRFHAQKLYPTVAYELEFYLVSKERDHNGTIQPPCDPITGRVDSNAVLAIDRVSNFGDCLQEITRCCSEQHIPTGPISAELGPGQYEINLEHHNDPILAADQCAAFKRIVKGVAKKHGYQATFMAKPYLDHPGNGLHLHTSLYNEKGENVMQLNERAILHYAVAGCLELLPASMALLAANRNTYRRLQPNNFTAVSASWGYENRSVAVRIPDSDLANTRLEHRLASADANPYLALSAILAGILHGVNKKLDPGEPCDHNADEAGGLPLELNQALQLLRSNHVLRELLGEKFVDVYCAQKYGELQAFEHEISAREYDWYL